MYRNGGGKRGNHLDDFLGEGECFKCFKLILTYVEL